jgi:hypothetical protein
LLFSSLASPKANTGLVRLCLRGSLVEDVRKGPGHPCVLGDGFSLDQFGSGWSLLGGRWCFLLKLYRVSTLEYYYSGFTCLTDRTLGIRFAIACHALGCSRFGVAKAVNHCHLIGCLRLRVVKALNLQKPFK